MILSDYPVLTGNPVTQAHVQACRESGHATHTVNGADTGVCPRCGAVAWNHDRNDDGGIVWVWCPSAMAPSTTRGGACTDCGAADHDDLATAQAAERAWIDGAE